jgi:hypothetical protein
VSSLGQVALRVLPQTDDEDRRQEGIGAQTAGGKADMSTITRESVRNALPQTGRGDALFAVVALLVCMLALILKVSGVA